MMPRVHGALIGAAALLAFASPAMACGTSPFEVVLPGFALTSPDVTFPLPLLAALFQRPLFTLAGVQRGALALSIQASLIATGVVSVVVPMFVAHVGTLGQGLTLLASAVLATALLEWVYVWARLRRRLAVWPFLAGAAVAAAVTFSLPYVMYALGANHWIPQMWYWRNLPSMVLAALGVVAVIYGAAFFRPITARPADPDRALGFEVVRPTPKA